MMTIFICALGLLLTIGLCGVFIAAGLDCKFKGDSELFKMWEYTGETELDDTKRLPQVPKGNKEISKQ